MRKNHFMIKSLVFIMIIALAAGCTATQEETSSELPPPKLFDVSIQISPIDIQKGEPVTIEAIVTLDSEKIEDASEVKFEFKNESREESTFAYGSHQGEGVYSVEETFNEDGVYSVTAHVTARNMHNMPKKQFIVGNVDQMMDEDMDSNEMDHENMDESMSEAIAGELGIHLMGIENVVANDETDLTAHLQQGDQLLIDAKVQFEVWFENNENHEYVDASEEMQGMYKSDYIFTSTGTYNVTIHVEKGEEIHDHKEFKVEVK
ncbi:FixH family protein [Chengkuizengella axinellae]|uniref:FixH family protein n=1 Tax=Chengkuizengella axinellae TaxID=3064388 RepID=A0ABT9J3L5_9BACL|nr:FixH family protein [Chengkuizengella sp. 2205SS18-9]MDP5275579.1 FixH family protein [Chengkuizengella sp. 2205SS18-9]